MYWSRTIGVLCVTQFLATSAWGQYSLTFNNRDDQGSGTKYFGSARDERGALMPGVAIEIARYFIMVTNEQGRFRGNIDFDYIVAKTPIRCSKPGYTSVRVVKRKAPVGVARKMVEVECILHKTG